MITFDFITRPIYNAINILSDLAYGEVPTQKQVSELLADGISIIAISEATGIAVTVLENLTDD